MAPRTPDEVRHYHVSKESKEQILDAANAGAGWRALAYLSIAELLALSLWFSATAVLPALAREWKLGDSGPSPAFAWRALIRRR